MGNGVSNFKLYRPKDNELIKYMGKSNLVLMRLINNGVYNKGLYESLLYLHKNKLIKYYLYHLGKEVNLQWHFECCLDYGDLKIIKWIYNYSIRLNKKIKLYGNDNYIYKLACYNQRIDVLNWLKQKSIEDGVIVNLKDVKILNKSLLRWLCITNKLTTLRWICNNYKVNEDDINMICIDTCKNNRINIFKWISSKYLKIVNKNIDDYFNIVCKNNYIKLAKEICLMNDNFRIIISNNRIIEYKIIDDFHRFMNDEINILQIIKLLNLRICGRFLFN